MSIDPETAHLFFKLVCKIDRTIKEGQKLQNNSKIDKQFREIIDKYELLYCESAEEVLKNWYLLASEEKTIFLKCFPEFFQVIEQEKVYWDNRFL